MPERPNQLNYRPNVVFSLKNYGNFNILVRLALKLSALKRLKTTYNYNKRQSDQVLDMSKNSPRTLVQKIFDAHLIKAQSGASLVQVDRMYMDESSYLCFDTLRAARLNVKTPGNMYVMVSHLAPTYEREKGPTDPEIKWIFEKLEDVSERFDVHVLRYDDSRQGIYHVVGPEQGITLPGMLMAGTDSHMTTHGALGALTFSVGYDEAVHVLVSDTLWVYEFEVLNLRLDGHLPSGVGAKDLALYAVSSLGASGASNCIVEITGETLLSLPPAGRMTLCNLMVEAGARGAVMPVDDITLDYVTRRPGAPKGAKLDKALSWWKELVPDRGARYDRSLCIDVSEVEPTVSWGTTTAQVAAIGGHVPDPAQAENGKIAKACSDALNYMALTPGHPIAGIPIDQVFIGSCTNGRIEDLREAAAVLQGRKAVVPGLVTPGSTPVRLQAEQEGLHRVFLDAGLAWGEAGCSMCFGHHDAIVSPGNRCASTTNRSFPGRQGPNARTHLMSPAMAAAAAVTGCITDYRSLMSREEN